MTAAIAQAAAHIATGDPVDLAITATIGLLAVAFWAAVVLLVDALADVRADGIQLGEACRIVTDRIADLPPIQLTDEQEQIVAAFVAELDAEPTAGVDR